MSEAVDVYSCKVNAKLLWKMHDQLDALEETEDSRRLKLTYRMWANYFEYEADRAEALQKDGQCD